MTVAVVLGVYQPDLDWLGAQLQSLTAQTLRPSLVVAALDGPDAAGGEARAMLERAGAQLVGHTGERLGIRGNFLRGLAHALALTERRPAVFAYCDQDDVWHPGKLARQVGALSAARAALCYCDARVIESDGRESAASLFALERRHVHRDLAELLLVNDVSGMSAVFAREVAESATALAPRIAGTPLLHDWWTALVAGAVGQTLWLPEPLLDYRRHSRNVIGAKAVTSAAGGPAKRPFLSASYRAMVREGLAWRLEAAAVLDDIAGRGPVIAGSLAPSSLAGRCLAARWHGERALEQAAFRCLVAHVIGRGSDYGRRSS